MSEKYKSWIRGNCVDCPSNIHRNQISFVEKEVKPVRSPTQLEMLKNIINSSDIDVFHKIQLYICTTHI